MVLHTFYGDDGELCRVVYYWIGDKASQDKVACAAMYSVYLRNHLGGNCKTRVRFGQHKFALILGGGRGGGTG